MTAFNFMPVEVNFKPAGKYWIASCPDFDLATQGESFESAHDNLAEALMLFIESCLKRGTLDEVLRQAGYTKTQISNVRKSAQNYISALSGQVENEACHV
jgi:predicted RNase H-like HicB family nuclease